MYIDIEFAIAWVLMGVLCYIIFSTYMVSSNRQHVKDNPLVGTLLFIAALVLGPLSMALFFVYALTAGAIGEFKERFKPVSSEKSYDKHAA